MSLIQKSRTRLKGLSFDICENKILMVKNDKHPYFYTVGGRVEYGETSESAVLREAFEETNMRFEIERLAFVHENFTHIDCFGDSFCHEVGLYYLMKTPGDISHMKCDSRGESGVKESLHWLPLDKLADFHFIIPSFTKPSCVI